MKKKSLFFMKVVIGLTILLGVLIILIVNEKSFKKIVVDDIENISKLSSSIIYAEIDNSLTKPIFVGQTMANDLFLKKWLSEEVVGANDPAQTAIIQEYLSSYSKKYGYDSVFLVSAKSNTYYYQEGINKVVDADDAHDVWYYSFIDSKLAYDLDVDVDEANNNQLTVFTNCRIEDTDGTLLGVVGVGIQMKHLQSLLQKYNTQYELNAFLMNEQGLIQVDAKAENIETVNFFQDPEALALKERILKNKTSMDVFWYKDNGTDHCLITQYVDNLDWYIVIEKNTTNVQTFFAKQINQDLLFVAVIIVLVLLMVSCILGHYNRMLLKTASIDDVTNLPNAKMFREIFNQNRKRPACRTGMVFLFDIDRFKDINDHFGHLFGNTMLYRISEIAKETLGSKGVVARWGGDEFIGVIYGSKEDAIVLLNKIVSAISAVQCGDLMHMTISLGITSISIGSDLDVMIKEADIAMYQSKANGRNQVTFYNPRKDENMN